jgi:predicted GIY-YIG superfamily endonuclease
MVHWIYVLECEDNYLYVGETTRLFRRFSEHRYGRGGVNTGAHKPDTLVALYKVADNYSFLQHRSHILQNDFNKDIIDEWGSDDSANLEIENHIAGRLSWVLLADNKACRDIAVVVSVH